MVVLHTHSALQAAQILAPFQHEHKDAITLDNLAGIAVPRFSQSSGDVFAFAQQLPRPRTLERGFMNDHKPSSQRDLEAEESTWSRSCYCLPTCIVIARVVPVCSCVHVFVFSYCLLPVIIAAASIRLPSVGGKGLVRRVHAPDAPSKCSHFVTRAYVFVLCLLLGISTAICGAPPV